MKKPTIDTTAKLSALATVDPKAWAKWPALRGFFMDAVYDDGLVPRLPGQMIIRPDAARWTLLLKEPSACTQLLVGATTFDEAIILVEGLLQDPAAPWVVDTWAEARKPKPVTRARRG